jgi:transposase
MATMQSEREQLRPAPEEMAPKQLEDIDAVRAYLTDLLKKGRGEQALEMLLDLLVRMKDAHTATTVRLHDALRQLYGRKSERLDSNQLELFLSELVKGPEGGDDGQQRRSKKTKKARKKRSKEGPRGRKALPDHLPRRESVIMPEPSQCTCDCGQEKSVIGYEISEWLDFEPASLFVRREKRAKLACAKCRDSVVCAPASESVIDKALVGPGLLAMLIVGRFNDGLPGNRQQKILETRYRVRIPLATIGDWISAGTDRLKLLVPLLKKRALKDFLVQTDDTGFIVLDSNDPRGRKRGHIWLYVGEGGNVFAEYTPDWSAEGPQAVLMQREGYIQVDGYAGYDALFEGDSPRIAVGCWMHARRGFERAHKAGDSRGTTVMLLIKQLYAVETKANEDGVTDEERLKRRLEHSAPVCDEIFELLDGWVSQVTDKTPLDKAIKYARNRKVQLTRFLEDGRIPLDNGEPERLNRRIALVRKNSLFFGSDAGAERGAAAFSVILSCYRIGIDPWEYLRDVLLKLNSTDFPQSRLEELLPENWAKQRENQALAEAEAE